MAKTTTIAGLEFELIFCRKRNNDPIKRSEISFEPSTNIYKDPTFNKYVVNIFSFVPKEIKEIKSDDFAYIVLNNIEGTECPNLVFSYEGVLNEKNPFNKDQFILYRKFCIDYNCTEHNPEEFDLYHTQIAYSIKDKNSLFVEDVIIHDKNLDPETDRGTHTVIRDY